MLDIKEYVDIKNFSTLQIGGQFRYFIIISSALDLLDFYKIKEENSLYKDIPTFILGGGSNVVFSDGVLDVIAIKIEIKGFNIINESDEFIDIEVGSGEIWDDVVLRTIQMGISSLEPLSIIPGTVGAGPVQNIGAYGVEVKDFILQVEVFDIKDKFIKNISNKDCKFSYRESIFKNEFKGKYIITKVVYRLNKKRLVTESPALKYPGVLNYFKDNNILDFNSKQLREAIIEIRKSKLPNPKEIPNVGSFFKNPIVKNEVSSKIKEMFPEAKFFNIDNNFTKIPAGWLIENAGLKGKSFGSVSIYDKNALVLVNNGGATKEDIINAKNEIIKVIEERFGITLEQEPEVI